MKFIVNVVDLFSKLSLKMVSDVKPTNQPIQHSYNELSLHVLSSFRRAIPRRSIDFLPETEADILGEPTLH